MKTGADPARIHEWNQKKSSEQIVAPRRTHDELVALETTRWILERARPCKYGCDEEIVLAKNTYGRWLPYETTPERGKGDRLVLIGSVAASMLHAKRLTDRDDWGYLQHTCRQTA